MKNYTYTELGMLLGAGIGGAAGILCFYLWNNVLFFAAAAVGIALGVSIGNTVEKKSARKKVRNEVNNT
ncbi:MAG: hypothetical protein N3I35_01215 [Clostridia bacterium]|nr:hypothetical protein [Clostridia bacterium]